MSGLYIYGIINKIFFLIKFFILYSLGEALWSDINNALLLDTGWYIVNDLIVDNSIKWGKNKTCSFIDLACGAVGVYEFCTTSKIYGLTFS